MPRYRISLAGSLGIVAVIAMGLAGMRSASSLWTTAAATLTLALLLLAVLAARMLDGSDGAFWVGFALFGWSYLLLVNWDWIGGQFGHDLTAGLSDLAESMFAEVNVPAPPQPPGPAPAVSAALSYELARQRQIKMGNFVQIGRMFLSLIFGTAGGFIARALAEARDSASGEPPATGTTGRPAG